MFKENGMDRPADKKEKASANTKKVECPRCENTFNIGTSTVFGEEIVCPACGKIFIS